MKIAQRPAVLCVADDFVAGVVLQVAAEKELKVPDDLAVISLNDLGIAEKLLPPVTALHISPDELGQKAAQVLIGGWKKGDCLKTLTSLSHPALLFVPRRESRCCQSTNDQSADLTNCRFDEITGGLVS